MPDGRGRRGAGANDHDEGNTMNSREQFDYIVIGAGAAGCVVAARLAEDPKTSVLLLEEGPDDRTIYIKANGGFFKTHGTDRTFLFDTEPEPNAGGRRIPLLQGRTLGGGTAVNAMCYIRGQAEDYDGWARDGMTGWSYEEVLPYFRKAEDNERPQGRYHGTGGPMKVSDPVHRHVLNSAFIQAAQETTLPGKNTQIPRNDDFNGQEQLGVGFYQQMSRRGERWSTARSFLAQALRRGNNLVVRPNSPVQRIVVDQSRAVGVAVGREGTSTTLSASREIILCAGAFMSPKILMLSGIGPAEELKRLGIEVLLNSPNVGRNYQDHMLAPVDAYLKEPISFAGQDRGLNALKNGLQWLLFRTGPLASNVCEAGGFFDIDRDGRAEIQLNAIPVGTSGWGENATPVHCFALSPVALTCHSRGAVTLRSRNAADPPRVQGNYLHKIELDTLVEGVRISRRILAAPSIAKYFKGEALPGAGVGDDREALAEYVLNNTKTALHPTSTCAMGARSDAVLDPQLRVRGVHGLRVVDASAMPHVPRGNTTAPIVMMAERAADMIKGKMSFAGAEA
jgi:choline dehydrogenase